MAIDTLHATTANALAKLDLERDALERDLADIANTAAALSEPDADRYIDLVRLQTTKVDKMIVVPANMPGLKLNA